MLAESLLEGRQRDGLPRQRPVFGMWLLLCDVDLPANLLSGVGRRGSITAKPPPRNHTASRKTNLSRLAFVFHPTGGATTMNSSLDEDCAVSLYDDLLAEEQVA
jgi:hypothetical protein